MFANETLQSIFFESILSDQQLKEKLLKPSSEAFTLSQIQFQVNLALPTLAL